MVVKWSQYKGHAADLIVAQYLASYSELVAESFNPSSLYVAMHFPYILLRVL